MKTHIVIEITEGGNFDRDSDNSTLTDPGAPGAMVYMVPLFSSWVLLLLVMLIIYVAFMYLEKYKIKQ